jgi:dihydrofolate reductase
MGRRMFDEGEVGWPEEAPFHGPVFVLTHHAREPWPRKGGTTFYFVTGGIDDALARAKAAAGGKDVRIAGGADTIRQYLAAGLVDDFTIHTAPLLLGAGKRLFDQPGGTALRVTQGAASQSPLASHVAYRVRP